VFFFLFSRRARALERGSEKREREREWERQREFGYGTAEDPFRVVSDPRTMQSSVVAVEASKMVKMQRVMTDQIEVIC
jgi:hypothetical protein